MVRIGDALMPRRYADEMIPMTTSTIIRHRWWVLLWAAGFSWFARAAPLRYA